MRLGEAGRGLTAVPQARWEARSAPRRAKEPPLVSKAQPVGQAARRPASRARPARRPDLEAMTRRAGAQPRLPRGNRLSAVSRPPRPRPRQWAFWRSTNSLSSGSRSCSCPKVARATLGRPPAPIPPAGPSGRFARCRGGSVPCRASRRGPWRPAGGPSQPKRARWVRSRWKPSALALRRLLGGASWRLPSWPGSFTPAGVRRRSARRASTAGSTLKGGSSRFLDEPMPGRGGMLRPQPGTSAKRGR